jgi:hypothetical protein
MVQYHCHNDAVADYLELERSKKKKQSLEVSTIEGRQKTYYDKASDAGASSFGPGALLSSKVGC